MRRARSFAIVVLVLSGLLARAVSGGEVSIDKQRCCLVVDGKPFFAVGCMDIPPASMQECVAAGINLSIRWGTHAMFGDALKTHMTAGKEEARRYLHQYLDAALRAGMRVIEHPCLFAPAWGSGEVFFRNFEMFVQSPLPELVDLVKDHPALLAYYGPDEADFAGTKPEWRKLLGRYSDVIRAHDPRHPVCLLFAGRAVSEWTETYDILAHDFYPRCRQRPLSTVYHTSLVGSAQAHKCQRPYWHTPQLEYIRGDILPPVDQRAMTYLAIAGGADGIVWWAWPPRQVKMWSMLKQLAGELRALTPVLTEPPAPTDVEWTPPQMADTVVVRAIRHQGHTWLIAVNATESPADVRMKLPATASGEAKVWFEDRRIEIAAQTIVDRFQGYERHVYEVDCQWPESAKIKLAVKLPSLGAKVRAESARRPQPRNLIVDPGFEGSDAWTFSAGDDSPGQAQGRFDVWNAHGGKRAASIVRTGARGESLWRGSHVALKPNTFYTFGGWAKVAPFGGVDVQIYLCQKLDGEMNYVESRTQMCYVRHFGPWSRYSTVFRTGDTPITVRPYCRMKGLSPREAPWLQSEYYQSRADGRAWFDDLFLLEAPPDVTNMLLNGSFEGLEEAPGWPKWWSCEWSVPSAGHVGGERPTWGIDRSEAYEGRNSFRIVVRAADLSKGARVLMPFVQQNLRRGVRLFKDRSYVFSAWMKADRANLPVLVVAGRTEPLKISTRWERYSFTARPREDTPLNRDAHIQITFRTEGTLWIDNVQLEPGTEPTPFNEFQPEPSNWLGK